jgi:hypothetical protein
MRALGRRALTATAVGLLLVAGCTAGGPRRQPPDREPPAPVSTAPSLPATSLQPGPAPLAARRTGSSAWSGMATRTPTSRPSGPAA